MSENRLGSGGSKDLNAVQFQEGEVEKGFQLKAVLTNGKDSNLWALSSLF